MTRLTLAALSLIALFYVSPASNASDDIKTILGGSFHCQTGSLKFSKGALNKQEFPSLTAAQAALAGAYNREGVDKLAGLLPKVCEEKDVSSEPSWDTDRATTADWSKPSAVAEFHKEGDLVMFKVFELEDNVSTADFAKYYMDKMDYKKKCRPISSICWKCPDGEITCSIPQVSK